MSKLAPQYHSTGHQAVKNRFRQGAIDAIRRVQGGDRLTRRAGDRVKPPRAADSGIERRRWAACAVNTVQSPAGRPCRQQGGKRGRWFRHDTH